MVDRSRRVFSSLAALSLKQMIPLALALIYPVKTGITRSGHTHTHYCSPFSWSKDFHRSLIKPEFTVLSSLIHLHFYDATFAISVMWIFVIVVVDVVCCYLFVYRAVDPLCMSDRHETSEEMFRLPPVSLLRMMPSEEEGSGDSSTSNADPDTESEMGDAEDDSLATPMENSSLTGASNLLYLSDQVRRDGSSGLICDPLWKKMCLNAMDKKVLRCLIKCTDAAHHCMKLQLML